MGLTLRYAGAVVVGSSMIRTFTATASRPVMPESSTNGSTFGRAFFFSAVPQALRLPSSP